MNKGALIFSRVMDEKSYAELEEIYHVSASTLPSISRLLSIISPEMAVLLQSIDDKPKAETTPKIEIKPEGGILADQQSEKSKEILGAIRRDRG